MPASTKKDKVILENVSVVYKLYPSHRYRLLEAFTRKTYHTVFKALDNVSLRIPEGTVLGILGANGAGKSTLCKIVAGILKPRSGKVIVDGKVTPLIELGAGFHPEYTGIENIYFYGALMGLTHREMEKRIQSIIDFADLGEYIEQPLKTYSSGMRARLAFSVSTMIEPDILILDEILSVGDVAFQKKSIKKIQELIQKGSTAIFVSHNLPAIRRLCSKAIILHRGKLLFNGMVGPAVDLYSEFIFGDAQKRERMLRNFEQFTKKRTLKSNLITNTTFFQDKGGASNSFFDQELYWKNKKITTTKASFPIKMIDSAIFDANINKVNILMPLQEYHIHIKLKPQRNYTFFPLIIITIRDKTSIILSNDKVFDLPSITFIKDRVFQININFTNFFLNEEIYFFSIKIKNREFPDDPVIWSAEDLFLFRVKNSIKKNMGGYFYLPFEISFRDEIPEKNYS